MIHVVTWLIENAIAIVLSSNNEVIDLTTCVPTWRSLCSLTYSWAADLFISIPSSWMMIPPRHWIVYPPGINRGVEHCSNNPKRRTSPMPWQWYLGQSHPSDSAVPTRSAGLRDPRPSASRILREEDNHPQMGQFIPCETPKIESLPSNRKAINFINSITQRDFS